jgi:hypothetical protein
MNLFSIIDDAKAIIRLPKGVEKQVDLFHRNGSVYVPHGGGFVRVTTKFGDTHSTSHPSVKVVEFDARGVAEKSGKLEYNAPLAVAA